MTHIAGIEKTDLIEARIQPSGSKKEVLIAILPDTGAQIDAIPADMYRNEIREAKLLPRGTINAITATGSPIANLGTFKATIRWPKGKKSKSVNTIFHVLQDLKQPVISKRTQKSLGMLPASYPHESINAIWEEPLQDLNSSTFFLHLKAPVVINTMEERKISNGFCQLLMGLKCHLGLKEGEILNAHPTISFSLRTSYTKIEKRAGPPREKVNQSIIHSFNQSISSGAEEKLFSKGDRAIPQHPISKHWTAQANVKEFGPNCNFLDMTRAGRPFCRNRRMLLKRVPVMPEESTPGPSVQPAPTPSPPPEENEAKQEISLTMHRDAQHLRFFN